jgi:hypothetical protein
LVFRAGIQFESEDIQKEKIQGYWAQLLKSKSNTKAIAWSELVSAYDHFEVLHAHRLTKAEYEQITAKKKGLIAKTIDYARLTFILSFIGFLGSIGFYFGVLREVYSPARDKQKIEVLTSQNGELQKTINVLIENSESGE